MKLHELLQTKNRGEQERKVAQLIQAAEAPVAVVAIVWDARTNVLNVVPVTGDIPIQILYALLERSRQLVQAQERQALLEQQQQQDQPFFEPGFDDSDIENPGLPE